MGEFPCNVCSNPCVGIQFLDCDRWLEWASLKNKQEDDVEDGEDI